MDHKDARWIAMEEKLMKATEEMYPIDKGILDTVIVMNLLNLPTYMSCEGHRDRAQASPWVMLETPGLQDEEWAVEQLFQKARDARTRND